MENIELYPETIEAIGRAAYAADQHQTIGAKTMSATIPAHLAKLMQGAVPAATAPVKRKKGETPRVSLEAARKLVKIPVPSTEMRELPMSEAFAELHMQFKDAEKRKDILTADLVAIVEPARVELARSEGAYLSSVAFDGLLYVHAPPHFTVKLKGDRAQAAQEAFGENFFTYFAPVCTLELTPTIIDALQNAGIVYELNWKPTKALQEARTLDAVTAAVCETQFAELTPIQYVRTK